LAPRQRAHEQPKIEHDQVNEADVAVCLGLHVNSLFMLTDEPKRSVRDDYDRRWISDDYFDLIVWYDRKDMVHGFQLCYGKP